MKGLLFLLGFCLLGALGYKDSSMIYGFIVPHSHDDVGWLETIDQYYDEKVQHIYNQVTKSLSANSTRKFIAVEMAYFSKWWDETSTATQKQQFTKLVKNKQLEFIIGGWTMEDEACTTYSTNIDQMTEGHQFIYNLFGVVPKYGWQVDPFGASNVVHKHFAWMGFNATIISRVPFRLKADRQSANTLEFTWHTSNSDSTSIFTHLMDQYSYPTAVHGLNWDTGDAPVTSANIQYLAEQIVQNFKERKSWFLSNAILFPWGDDFQHFIATMDFQNMDLLVDYINQRAEHFGVTVQYATLGEYFEAIQGDTISWPQFGSADYLPYNDEPDQYWSGYYTSRSALKGYIRSRENVMKTAELLAAFDIWNLGYSLFNQYDPLLQNLRRACAVATHHDAVSGTSQPWVVSMYADLLRNGTEAVSQVILNATAHLINPKNNGSPMLSLDDTKMNLITSTEKMAVILHNPLAWSVSRFVQVPAFSDDLQVLDSKNNLVPSDILPSIPVPIGATCADEDTCGYQTESPYRLFFLVNLPALGYSTYFIEKSSKSATVNTMVNADEFSISNSFLTLTFSNKSLVNVKNKNTEITVEQSDYMYNGNWDEGAYVFNPSGPPVKVYPLSITLYQGKYVQEVVQVFSNPCNDSEWNTGACGGTQIMRIYNSNDDLDEIENFIETAHNVGPLSGNIDYITKWKTNLSTNQTIYTDDNCMEIQKRDYDLQKSDPIGGNYFPCTCRSFIQDETTKTRVTVLTDRTRGISSQYDGELEIMFHRRVLSSDNKGLPNLDDQDHLENVQILVLMDEMANTVNLQHKLQYMQQFPPTMIFSPIGSSSNWQFTAQSSKMLQEFPPNVHLLSLKYYDFANSTKLLLRLAHIFESNEDSQYAQPITVDLSEYFSWTITGLNERSLTAVLPIESVLQSKNVNRREWEPVTSTKITLNPTQIRTFFVELKL